MSESSSDNPERLDFDRELIERRVAFLRDRLEIPVAEADLQHESARRSTSLRDVAMMLSMLEQYELSAQLFRGAGNLYSQLGLFYGYYLKSLTTKQDGIVFGDDLAHILQLFVSSENEERDTPAGREVFYRQYWRQSSTSVRQLVSLYQCVRLLSERSVLTTVAQAIRQILETRTQLMPIGMPLRHYLALFDAIVDASMNDEHHETLISAVTRRRVELDVARRDTYHWRMMLRPDMVVNDDFLALCLAAVRSHDERTTSFVMREMSRYDAVTRLPWDVANGLNHLRLRTE
jgi:hypothetical protein